MSLLFADGFDWLPSSSVLAALQTKYNSAAGSPQRTSARGTSGFGVYIPSNQIITTFPTESKVYVGAAVKIRFAPQRIFSFKNPSGTEQCYLNVDTAGRLVITGASATSIDATLFTDKWNYIEACVDFNGSISANDYWIRLNGVTVGSGTADLSATATANCGGVSLYDQQFDDFYVTNDSGGVSDNFRGFLGPVCIRTLFPIGSGLSNSFQNEKGLSSSNNFASVSGEYNGDSSYIEGSGDGTTCSFTLQDSEPFNYINGVRISTHARFVDSAYGYYSHLLQNSDGSTTILPGSGNINSSYSATSHNLSKSFITSNDWVVSEINDLNVGVRISIQ